MMAIQVPSTSNQSIDTTEAWKAVFLEITSRHLQTPTTTSSPFQLPPSQDLHLLDTHQLWQSLELYNKSIIPPIKRALTFLLPRTHPALSPTSKQRQPTQQQIVQNRQRHSRSPTPEPAVTRSPQRDSQPEPPNENVSKRTSLIQAMEHRNLAPKPWTLLGEVSAATRPKDSLLDPTLMYDTTRKVDNLLTEDLNLNMEDIIKQRITNSQFDDLVLQIPQHSKSDNEPLEQLSEKPTSGLAELYEQEFRVMHLDADVKGREEVSEICHVFQKVSQKLDALCSMATSVVSDVVRTSADAVPEDVVKHESIVNVPEEAGINERLHAGKRKWKGARLQRKRKRL